MEKLSQEERLKIARYLGVAKAFADAGYPVESIKMAMADSMPEGMEKDAFLGMLGRAGQWLIRGAKSLRAARMAGKTIKPGTKSFGFLGNIPRKTGMELVRFGKKPGSSLWEMGKGIAGNAIFPGMIPSKSMIGKGIGTGIFAKGMIGPMLGGAGQQY